MQTWLRAGTGGDRQWKYDRQAGACPDRAWHSRPVRQVTGGHCHLKKGSGTSRAVQIVGSWEWLARWERNRMPVQVTGGETEILVSLLDPIFSATDGASQGENVFTCVYFSLSGPGPFKLYQLITPFHLRKSYVSGPFRNYEKFCLNPKPKFNLHDFFLLNTSATQTPILKINHCNTVTSKGMLIFYFHAEIGKYFVFHN